MRMFRVTYIMTGSGEKKTTANVCISSNDLLNNGLPVVDISNVPRAFEEIAERWGSYENKNAIVKIELAYDSEEHARCMAKKGRA